MMNPSSSSSSNPTRDAMADGISIRVRVRRAPSTGKLEYGESQDMVCTIVNWEVQPPTNNRMTTRKSPRRRSLKKARSPSLTNGSGPTLLFHPRAHSGHTLETCCSLQSLSSFDSMDDPSIISETTKEDEANIDNNNNNNNKNSNNTNKESSPVSDMVEKLNIRSRMNNSDNNKQKRAFSIPCGSIKTVEKTSSLFRGYRIFFATGSRGAFELEFENKNGSDIMMAFLQATLPGERFVHLNNGANGGSVDGSETASHLSTLDVEKLTERLAERGHPETVSEKVRNGVAKVVSSLEDMSTYLCGSICCSGQFMSSSVAPYEPEEVYKRTSPPPSPSRYSSVVAATHLGVFTEPVMEIDEEKSTQTDSEDAFDSKDFDALRKRRYLREYQLPSGLSVELPPEPSSKYRLASV